MAKVILEGCKINQSTVSGHISTERYVPVGGGGSDLEGNPIPIDYGWVGGYSTSATINGTCEPASVSNVYIESKKFIVKDDKTKETDTYTLGSNERYASGRHTNDTRGKVSNGNSNNVYANGKLIAVTGATVTTHANTSTTVGSDKVSTTVNIGT